MSASASFASAGFAWDLLVKATVVLAATWAVAALAPRASAGTRHLRWTLALGALLVLVPAALALPRLSWLPSWTRPAALTAATIAGTGDARAVGGAGEADRPPRRAPAAATKTVVAAEPHDARRAGVDAVALAWAAGALVFALPLLFAWLRLRRLSATATPLDEAPWPELLADARAGLSLRRSVRLLIAPVDLMPLTWGLARATVLLPASARSWPRERQRLVLLHELAHVARLDGAGHLIARLACALFWMHPLVWLAAAELRREAERAADDRVLAAGGVVASSYASELLDLAARLRTSAGAAPAGIAMARPTELERRLLALLDAGRARAPVGRARGLASAALAGALVLPLAALGVSAPPAQPATAGPKPFDASMAAAVVVRTVPAAGATAVPSSTPQLRVTFSKRMLPGSYSFVQLSASTFPALEGAPTLEDAGRTYVLPVTLQPHHRYLVGLNVPPHTAFTDEDRRSALTYVLAFETGD